MKQQIRPMLLSVALWLGVCGGTPTAQAGPDVSIEVHGRVGGDPRLLVPVPVSGISVQLWSDPDAGALVRAGDRVRLYFEANADCYVTLLSVDTEGRVRMLYPGYHDDGWVRGGHTYRLPAGRDDYDLRFAGPSGTEYVYAVASLDPMRDRFPRWFIDGGRWDPEPRYDDCDIYDSGWVLGDPFYRVQEFCTRLVPRPDCPDRYFSTWISFCVGERVSHPRSVCRDCHGFHCPDPYGRPCRAVSIAIDGHPCRGWIDFRVVFAPKIHYDVCRDWRPRGRDRHDGPPNGKWRWSTVDGPKRLGDAFAEAHDGKHDRDRGKDRDHEPDKGRDHDSGKDRDRERERDRDRNGWDRGGEPRKQDHEVAPPRETHRDGKQDSKRDSKPDRDRGQKKDRARHRN